MSEAVSAPTRRSLLAAAVVAGASGAFPARGASESATTSPALRVPFLHGFPAGQTARQSELESLERAAGWINSAPLTASALRGKVVLIDFWTYTCINWRRTLPYVRAWQNKYRNQGLVVIGVHTPEFEFEKSADNVRWAVKDMRIDYPIAVDSDYVIWRAFANEYWPALYFFDSTGHVRYQQFGEGSYQQSEMIIQRLLAEKGIGGIDRKPVSVDASGFEAGADWDDLMSPENYLGYERSENFASPGGAVFDKPRLYELPARLGLNEWGLSGDWTVEKDRARLNQPNGSVAYQFHARDLHLVMAPSASGAPLQFRVLIDRQPPGAAHGVDVEGVGAVIEPRLYQLIRQPKPIEDRRFEIEFAGPGVEVFDFTFG